MPKSSSKSGMTKRQGPGLRTAPNSRSTSATPVSSHSRSVGSKRGRGRAMTAAGDAIVAAAAIVIMAPATIGRMDIRYRVLAPQRRFFGFGFGFGVLRAALRAGLRGGVRTAFAGRRGDAARAAFGAAGG